VQRADHQEMIWQLHKVEAMKTIQTYQVHFGSKNRIKYMSALLAISPGCRFKTDSGGAGIWMPLKL